GVAHLVVAGLDVVLEDAVERRHDGPIDPGSVEQPQQVLGRLVAEPPERPAADVGVDVDDHASASSRRPNSLMAFSERISRFSRSPISAYFTFASWAT